MNFLKKMALVASLAVVGMGSAYANGTYLQLDQGGFENSWSFDSAAFTENGVSGTKFGDYFIFNVLEDEYVSFSAFGTGVTFRPPYNAGPNDFSGFALWSLGLDPFLVDAMKGSTAHSIEGGEWMLPNGTYELDLGGSFTRAGGTYTLDIFGSPIPEPSGWALLLAGLGVTSLLARRRKHQA